MAQFVRSFSLVLLAVVAALLSTPSSCLAQQPPEGSGQGSGGSETSQWDPNPLRIDVADNVNISVTVPPGQLPRVTAELIDSETTGEFAVALVSTNGQNSIMVWGTVYPDQTVIVKSASIDAAGAGIPLGSYAAMRMSWGDLWSGYWYYLTNPSAMDTDLEVGFYVSGGTAVVAGGAAGGLDIAGVNPVIVAGGTSGAVASGTVVNAYRLNHIFGQAKHNLGGLVQAHGGSQAAAFSAVESATVSALGTQGITSGIFEITVTVGGLPVTVRGNIINGVVKIATFWM
jgi:hypothetical protein